MTLCSVSNIKQILFLSLDFREGKNKTQLGFPPSSADKGLKAVCAPDHDPLEPWAVRVQRSVQENSLEGHNDRASGQADESRGTILMGLKSFSAPFWVFNRSFLVIPEPLCQILLLA